MLSRRVVKARLEAAGVKIPLDYTTPELEALLLKPAKPKRRAKPDAQG